MNIFNNTPFEYSEHGLTGFNYAALKDQIKWAGLSRKLYVPTLLTLVNFYIKGINDKSK